MTGLVLHDFELDEGCYKVRLLLAALHVPHLRSAVNMVPGGEQTRPPLLLLNPLGTLPILEDGAGDDTVVLRDAEAILAYLAVRYDAARRWLPDEPKAFGQVMMWMTFASRDLHAAVLARRHAMFEEIVDGAAMTSAARRAFRVMDDHMTMRRLDGDVWFVGKGPTLADLALFPSFALSRDFSIDHEAYPALRRWMRRVRSIPGFTTMPGIPDYH
ncbi:glutathione S-transferase family protein [Lichenifustis flavocetrariae]|uniref:Glutathione binding-like protein n=1 Tax=Lichenifustis flavocetrariae TaxID=2949735 RepID=A0AA41YUC2_9HYPH|nr:glutathione binding-like protein [Lichenifustis flavocetrariae]MCW6507018.1 glutathione binding-like protein [Lichenifustis flavocetrariae]